MPEGAIQDSGLVSPEAQLGVLPYYIGYVDGMSSLFFDGLSSCAGGFGPSCNSKTMPEAYAAPYAHPVEAIQKDWLQRQLAARDVAWGNAYGMALPTRLKLEREILGQIKRPPGMPSSMLGLEIMTGRDETMDFDDFMGAGSTQTLGMPEEDVDTRAILEKAHGLVPRSTLRVGPAALNRDAGAPRPNVAMAHTFDFPEGGF